MSLDWLKAVAPTVATALAGPLGGLAVKVIGDALGTPDATKDSITDILQSGNMSGEQLAAIKTAEIQLKQHESDNNFKFAELDIRDRDSARQREVAVKDSTPTILAFTIVGAFIAIVGGTLLGYAKVESVMAGTLIGYLSAKAEQVCAYYFGSSAGSAKKTELLAQAPAIEKK